MEKLAQKNAARLIDLLSERLAFERAGVKLYDALLGRLRAATDPELRALLEPTQLHRDEESEHQEWLEEQIRALGGDPHAPSEHSVLVQKEAEGIELVLLRDPSIAHDFHALLLAELADHAGWDLLVQLAVAFGDEPAQREFEKRLRQEEEHLRFVREALLGMTFMALRGQATGDAHLVI